MCAPCYKLPSDISAMIYYSILRIYDEYKMLSSMNSNHNLVFVTLAYWLGGDTKDLYLTGMVFNISSSECYFRFIFFKKD